MSHEERCPVYLPRRMLAFGLTAPAHVVAIRARTVATLVHVYAFGRKVACDLSFPYCF